jgi:hypothetical protein
MSFQLTFLGYYLIKSPKLKKQTHSVKRRNWSHRERTAQANGPRWTAKADGFRWTAIADGLQRTWQPSASVGRPWRTAPAAGGRPPLPAIGGRSAPSVRWSRRPTDGGRPWDCRTRPDVRRTRPWTSGRVTTLHLRSKHIFHENFKKMKFHPETGFKKLCF